MGLNTCPWCIILRKSLPQNGPITSIFVQQPGKPTKLLGWTILSTSRKFKNGEKFPPMSACADCAGWHGSKLFRRCMKPRFQRARLIWMSHPLRKRDLIRPCRLIWVENVCFWSIFYTSKDNSTTRSWIIVGEKTINVSGPWGSAF